VTRYEPVRPSPVRGGSARPVGACLAWLVPERNGATSMLKRTPKRTRVVIGAVDSHGRTHHAAVIYQQGRPLGDQESLVTGRAVAATGCC
jgi:hypothetical protein